LFAAGECACVSINGANRLGSNSLTELLVFGGRAGRSATEYIHSGGKDVKASAIEKQAEDARKRMTALFHKTDGQESVSGLRKEMNDAMEAGAGIYRTEDSLKAACETIGELRERYANVRLEDKSNVFNTDLIQTLELGVMLDVAHALTHSALGRRESRGAHQRLDKTERDDETYLKHTLAYHTGRGDPRIEYLDVVITKSQPGERVYGGEQT
jgi:fumarate reductase flavoprotein subunit